MIDIKIEKHFYVLRKNNNFAYISKFDLVLEVKNESLYINSFVFYDKSHEWLLLESHPEIPNEIKALAKFSEDIINLPNFVPISYDDFAEFQKIKNHTHISEEDKIFDKKIHHYNAELGGVKKYFDEMFNETLQKESQILLSVKSLRKEFQELNLKDSAIVEYQEKIEKLNLKLKSVLIENEHLKTSLKKSLTKVEILQSRVNEGNTSLVSKVPSVPSELTLNGTPIPLSSDILGLDDLKKGKTFEFENIQMWYIQVAGETRGPLRFDELLVYKNNGSLNTCKVKKKSDFSWLDPSDVLELNCEISLKFEHKSNPEKNIYLAQRGEYRADVRETINFTVGHKEYKGYLTNISLTGGFVEVVKLDSEDHLPNKTVTLYFNEGFVSESIICDVKIRRISENRPKGFGFTFVNVPEKNVEIIGHLISSIISQNNKAA